MGDLLKLDVDDVWNDTLLVEYALSYDPICPLCLDLVRLGQALPCGHVFCHVCIQRCLKFAEEDNPMLYKCPVCHEGHLYEKLLRKCLVRTRPSSVNFALVRHGLRESDVVPDCSLPLAFSSRFKIATAEYMIDFVVKRRQELASARADLKRFRDGEGEALLKACDVELDSLYVEWKRQVGKRATTSPSLVQQEDTRTTAAGFYQNADGLFQFVHPVNLKTLDAAGQDLPLLLGLPVLEVNEWNSTVGGFARIPPAHCVPASATFVELDLTSLRLPGKAMEASRKETQERARRRKQMQDRLVRTQLTLAQQALAAEEARIAAREQEERLLLDFFGYTEQRVREEREERQRVKPVTPNLFSSVVSHMGHFPALPTQSTKPAATTPTAPPATTATSSSFSQATSHGSGGSGANNKKNKVPLFTNNPVTRRG